MVKIVRIATGVGLLLVIIMMTAAIVLHQAFPSHYQQVSATDMLNLAGGELIKVGDPIHGYQAPLENYVRIFTLQQQNSEESIYNWIDEKAIAMYYLPLFDSHGILKRDYFLVRISDDTFSATLSYPQMISDSFAEHQLAMEQLIEYCEMQNLSILSFRTMTTYDRAASVLLANSCEGIFGVLYNVRAFGGAMMLLPFDGELETAELLENAGRIMNEEELRSVLIAYLQSK